MYPIKVEINEENILALTKLFKKTYTEVIAEIEGATDFGVYNRKQILKTIETKLTDLGVDVDAFLKTELPNYYKSGADDAVKQLRNVGADVPIARGFNVLHQEAILALIDDTGKAFGEAITGVQRSANLILNKSVRDLITQKLASGKIKGEAMREVKQSVIGILKDQGLSAIVDKSGRKWDLDRYTEMLFRTKAVEARNRGLANRMAQNDYDLVQVSDHQGECELCTPWERRVLSLTGKTKGYPTVAEAEAEGLFHPNCRHAINVLVPELAEATKAYDPDTKTYVLSKEKIDSLM